MRIFKPRKRWLVLLLLFMSVLIYGVLMIQSDKANSIFTFFSFGKSDSAHSQNPLLVLYFNGSSAEKVDAEVGEPQALLPDTLFLKPGKYLFEGQVFDLRKEGLYRFLKPGKANIQRVVYEKDMDALCSAIAWIVSHGNSCNGFSAEELEYRAMTSKLYLTCSHVSRWAVNVLRRAGVQCRLVAGLTLQDWNTYDNGHTLVEVWKPEFTKWAIYDFDNNLRICSPEGIPLSLFEFSEASGKGKYQLYYISSDALHDVSGNIDSSGYSYGFYFEYLHVNLSQWYARVMEVPMIFEEVRNKFLFFDSIHRKRVENYSTSYQYIPEEQFRDLFY